MKGAAQANLPPKPPAAVQQHHPPVNGKQKAEQFQNERDKFLKDFEKPTQIYRFLSRRMLHSPLFLYRNLSYMFGRRNNSKTKRNDFKTSDILKEVERKISEENQANLILSKSLQRKFVNLIIVGFWDGQKWVNGTEAKVDLTIVRICVKKRKDSRVPISKAYEGSCSVKVKSIEDSKDKIVDKRGKYPVLSVPKDCFNLVNGHIVESIRLVVRVTVPEANLIHQDDKDSDLNKNNGLSNGKMSSPNGRRYSYDNCSEEPKPKRQRCLPRDRENFIYDDPTKTTTRSSSQNIVYVGMLSVYEKDSRINIPNQGDADLEIRLNRQDNKRNGVSIKRIRREASWESLEPEHMKVQDYFSKNEMIGCIAKLRVALRSSSEEMKDTSSVTPLTKETKDLSSDLSDNFENGVRVVYQFVQGNITKQMTESRNDLRCPWCSVNCIVLYSLLKHLDVCHPRFRFTFTRIENGARVDVCLNESYDGSYSGSAYDLVSQPPGEAFARKGPSKRTQVFSMLTFKPAPIKKSLDEFFDNDEKDLEQRRSYMTGHNRLYHHTTTCLPIHPREIDVDSEGEPDPEWLKVKTCMMIDEFTDVNEGEKEIMKMWNHHVMHDNYVGDCQIPLACKTFVESYGRNVIEKNLYRNFVLHLTNLFDFGLLPAQGFHSTIQLLHSQMKDNNTATCLRDSWKASTALSLPDCEMADTSNLTSHDHTTTNGNHITANKNSHL